MDPTPATDMHHHGDDARRLEELVFAFAAARMAMDPPPLDGPRSAAELAAATGPTITEAGLGAERVMDLFEHVLAPACVSIDHPRYLAFVPSAATEAATIFDLVVGASNIYGGSWMEGAGAVHAENQALRWLADLAGMPAGAGGTFVSGGSLANLSALAVARHRWRVATGSGPGDRPGVVVVSDAAHSSIAAALDLLDLEPFEVGTDHAGRLRPDEMDAATRDRLEATAPRVAAVVGSAGLTNSGGVDDLAGLADLAASLGAWFHVDAAYGGGALCSPRTRPLFDGIERVDSLTIDPHKWLFAPFDCAAILYRHPEEARATFTQRAAYLEALTEGDDWNPSDYGPHLSRRARGLPFWFSVAVHGTDAYREAVEGALDVTAATADLVAGSDHLELVMEPELSVVLFRRIGWTDQDYWAFSHRLLADQVGFVVPTRWQGETVLRLCVVNPRTTMDDIRAVLPPA